MSQQRGSDLLATTSCSIRFEGDLAMLHTAHQHYDRADPLDDEADSNNHLINWISELAQIPQSYVLIVAACVDQEVLSMICLYAANSSPMATSAPAQAAVETESI